MDKIVFADPNSKERKERVRRTKVPTRRVRGEDGTTTTVYILEASAPNLTEQLEKVFQLNVRRARRAHPKASAIAAE